MANTTITCALKGCDATKTVDLEAMKKRIAMHEKLSDDWFWMGANDNEGRPDDLFFDKLEHYRGYLNA